MARQASAALPPAGAFLPLALARALVFDALRAGTATSRAALGGALGLGRGAVERALDDLETWGLLSPSDVAHRRSTVSLALVSRIVVCAQLRATRGFVYVTDLGGRRVSAIESFAAPRSADERDARVGAAVTRLLASNRTPCAGVDVTLAGSGASRRIALFSLDAPAVLHDRIGLACRLARDGERSPHDVTLALWSAPRADTGQALVRIADAIRIDVHGLGSGDAELPAAVAELSNRRLVARYLGRAAAGATTAIDAAEVIARARAGEIGARVALLGTAVALADCVAGLGRRFGSKVVFLDGEIASAWDMIDSAVRGRIERVGCDGSGPRIVALRPGGGRLRGAALVAPSLSPGRVA